MTQETQVAVESDDVPGPLAGAVTGAAYGMLFLLGVVLGVVGGFQHAWYAGQVPVAAIAWLAALFAVPYAMGRLMGGRLGALVPAVGWLLVSYLLATPQQAGDLAIAGNSAGYWYLYGGAVAVAAAVVVTRSTNSWLLTSYSRA
ncbi:DUF6113 family protein [Microbispora bryophytorum]|uniref:Integral membrane protein n=1 Tax=Microbispora bryophytorum TaxID=1460882 RepID=A0A8H9H0K0_9ACTN|nr:DUF6113 family protein [Microbispora bryophytorum]MBD3136692.1 hypothetical protein [Microbispora bryophytorum]TQS06277.1 hypothetical protein FLX07_14595 [Microbispora bryophytorum]GGO17622.1 hypothetical protein GCM10011574_41430 [Microbispora bryophytorum]